MYFDTYDDYLKWESTDDEQDLDDRLNAADDANDLEKEDE
jgi:hypothetical protein